MNKEVVILGHLDISALVRASDSLQEALALEASKIVRDGTIQRFEYTFELSWKMLKKVLRHKGAIVNAPRDIFREAAQFELIDNPGDWIQFQEFRNMTSHVYDEEVAEKIYQIIPDFGQNVLALLKVLEAL